MILRKVVISLAPGPAIWIVSVVVMCLLPDLGILIVSVVVNSLGPGPVIWIVSVPISLGPGPAIVIVRVVFISWVLALP